MTEIARRAAAALHRGDDHHAGAVALAAGRRPPAGFVQLNGHVHEEAPGIAVPVRDQRGDVVAAVSAIVSNDGQGHTRIPALLAAARGVQRPLSTPRPSLIG